MVKVERFLYFGYSPLINSNKKQKNISYFSGRVIDLHALTSEITRSTSACDISGPDLLVAELISIVHVRQPWKERTKETPKSVGV